MLKVELKEGTEVFTSDGTEVGRINRFVMEPSTKEVTHIVVQKGGLLSEDRVVPFELVSSATADKVVLSEDIEDFNELPPFEESHFVKAGEEGEEYRRYPGVSAYYWYPPPTGYIGYPAYGLGYAPWPPIETQQNIPAGAVPLKEGTRIVSADEKHVGNVDRLFVEPESNKVTHFLISQGILFKDHKLIPANWIQSVGDDEVRLKVSANVLEQLPSYHS